MSVTTFRRALATALATQFTPDGVSVVGSMPLVPGAGMDGIEIAVYTDRWDEQPSDVNTRMSRYVVDFFDQWDPNAQNPYDSPGDDAGVIEAYADRVVAAVVSMRNPNVGGPGWFCRVTSIAFQPDPSGGITRLQASVLAYDTNPMAP